MSAPGAKVVVEHVASLIAVHIIAPGRQFEKQGQKPGSLIVKAETRANCYVVMGMFFALCIPSIPGCYGNFAAVGRVFMTWSGVGDAVFKCGNS